MRTCLVQYGLSCYLSTQLLVMYLKHYDSCEECLQVREECLCVCLRQDVIVLAHIQHELIVKSGVSELRGLESTR